jgi:hypothetical protein
LFPGSLHKVYTAIVRNSATESRRINVEAEAEETFAFDEAVHSDDE